jgi:DNA-directed RNA polymerase subunit F
MVNNLEFVEDLSLGDIKQILSEKKKEKELNYEQKMAYEHAKIFTKITPAKKKKMKEELLELELPTDIIIKIIDVLPNKYQIDLIAEKNKCINDDNKNKIIEIVEKYKK